MGIKKQQLARHRIEMDIQQRTIEELKETIIHEYQNQNKDESNN